MKILKISRGFIKVALIFLIFFSCANTLPAQSGRRISMDFQEAALKDVLKAFSQQAGLNFVATDNIRDRVITLYLDGVTVEDALNSIMKANNLIYEQAPESNVFVVKDSQTPTVDMITRIYKLKYARVATVDNTMQGQVTDIKALLNNALAKKADGSIYGNIVVDKRTNSVIITTVAEDFPQIERMLKELDAMSPQALIEAEVVEIKTNTLKTLGLEWGTSTGSFVSFTGPVRGTNFPFLRDRGMLKSNLVSDLPLPDTLVQGTLSLSEFTVLLKALETKGLAHYLAKPRMMVLSNETAEINITANTAIGIESRTITETGEVIEKAERQETGVSLKVTPTINENNYITMTLEPSVSRPIQSTFFAQFVDPAKRGAKTTVMVKDGQTIAIGGLIQADEENANRKTPGLSKIPLFGNLFNRDENRLADTELVIFITAHAIRDVAEIGVDLVEIDKEKEQDTSEATAITGAEKQLSDDRESEIRKTVIKLRKKRELSKEN